MKLEKLISLAEKLRDAGKLGQYEFPEEERIKHDKWIDETFQNLVKAMNPEPVVWVDPPDCPRCGLPLTPIDSVYGQWQCPRHSENTRCVWFDYELIMILRQKTPKVQTFPYFVTGDHPVLARPDKRFPDQLIAAAYAEDLKKLGYENVHLFRMVDKE